MRSFYLFHSILDLIFLSDFVFKWLMLFQEDFATVKAICDFLQEAIGVAMHGKVEVAFCLVSDDRGSAELRRNVVANQQVPKWKVVIMVCDTVIVCQLQLLFWFCSID